MSIYADYAATAPMSQAAKMAMLECMDIWGNPSSLHSAGKEAAQRLNGARKTVAELLNCRTSEIYFTSGGTEANNWAIHGARRGDGVVVTSAFEHHAVLHTLDEMQGRGQRRVIKVAPETSGILNTDAVLAEVNEHTTLVTIMAANNELGTIQPIREIAKGVHEKGSIIHTDAVQAVGHIKVDVKKLGVDMLSMSGHKFGGPKGVGALYCNEKVHIAPFMFGGGQERGKRPGTENVASIVAMAVALQEACDNMSQNAEKVAKLRDRLIYKIKAIPGSNINGSVKHRLPGNVNCSFDGLEGEVVAILLDQAGVCVSSGSACTSGMGEPSHVLTAIGKSKADAYGAIRISLGEGNTEKDVDFIAHKLEEIAIKLKG